MREGDEEWTKRERGDLLEDGSRCWVLLAAPPSVPERRCEGAGRLTCLRCQEEASRLVCRGLYTAGARAHMSHFGAYHSPESEEVERWRDLGERTLGSSGSIRVYLLGRYEGPSRLVERGREGGREGGVTRVATRSAAMAERERERERERESNRRRRKP